MVEVGPGVIVTAEEANFIFERKNWIKEGEMGVFSMQAPSSMKFVDLCTLSLLLLDENFEEAKELVAECMSPAQQASIFRRDSNIYDSVFPMR